MECSAAAQHRHDLDGGMQALRDALPTLSPATSPKPPGLDTKSRQEPKARWKRLDQKPDARIYVPPKREASAPKPPATALPLANGRPHSNSKDPTGAGLHRCERCARSFINPRALDHHNRDKHSQMTEPVSRDKTPPISGHSREPRSLGKASCCNDGKSHSEAAGKADRQRNGKPKNTTCFVPSHEPPKLRVLCGPNISRYPRVHSPLDVVLVPGFFCEEGDLSLYDQLLCELKSSGKEDEGLWALWHGDSHVIANDRKGWKKLCPTFQMIVDKMAEYFNMDVKATRLNWYRDAKEWKPFHHDRAAFTPDCPQNCTVAASFGLSRDISFQHAKNSSMIVSFPQPNGSMYTFGREINTEWKHGVAQMPPDQQVDEGRISVIAWGWVPED